MLEGGGGGKALMAWPLRKYIFFCGFPKNKPKSRQACLLLEKVDSPVKNIHFRPFPVQNIHLYILLRPETLVDGGGQGLDPGLEQHLPRELRLVQVQDSASMYNDRFLLF